jgi:hypothetical protein
VAPVVIAVALVAGPEVAARAADAELHEALAARGVDLVGGWDAPVIGLLRAD